MKSKTPWLFFFAVLVFSSSTASPQSDPRTAQYMSGASNLIGSAQSVAWAQTNSTACAACEGICWSCVWVVTGYSSAGLSGAIAIKNFADATTLSTTGQSTFSPSSGIPVVPVVDKNPPVSPTKDDIQKLSDTANNILNISQQGLDDFKNRGQLPLDLNDPKLAEKLPPMTPEEKAALQNYENKKAKMEAMSTQEKVNAILAGDYASDSSRSIAGATIVSDTDGFGSFDPSSLFNFGKEGAEDSSSGYYGNVPLKVLNPHSKMSLFERVSHRMKSYSR